MNILISGAGPGGLCLAYWLKQYGFSPTIIESAPKLRLGGYKLDIRGVALDVVRRMGIYDAIVAASTNMQGAKLVDKQGNVIKEMSGDAFGHRVGDDQEIMRGTLCQIILDQTSNIEIIFDDAIQSIIQSEGTSKVEVFFKKNLPRSFELIIGADGLHSNVRRLVFGEESQFSKPFNIYISAFTVPNYLNLDRMEIQYTELGRVAALWSTRGDSTIRASFAFVSNEKISHTDVASQQSLIKKTFHDLNWEVPRMLEMMPAAPDFYFDHAAQIHMPKWSEGRVALVGDAAYCASPTSGQGLSLAIVGAYVLAGELAESKGDYSIAFQQYEKLMRPFIKANQAIGKKSAELFSSQENANPFVRLLSKLLNLIPGFMISFFINRTTQRIQEASKCIILKDYLSLVKS